MSEPVLVTRFMALALLTVLLGCSETKDAAAESTAGIVFHGGKIYTVNERQPWASAIAIKREKIVYVGDDQGALKLVGANTVSYTHLTLPTKA